MYKTSNDNKNEDTKIFVTFFNQLRSHFNPVEVKTYLDKTTKDATIRQYFKEFLTECLDKCDKIDYNALSFREKVHLDKVVAREIYPLLAKELKVA